MNKIERFYKQRVEWKLQQQDRKTGTWADILEGRAMRHGEAILHVKGAKMLGHSPLRIIKVKPNKYLRKVINHYSK